MTNPYKSPTSDIGDGNTGPESKLIWKILFWLILTLELLSLLDSIINPEERQIYIIGELLVYTAILTGLFGFAYNKKILNRKFWRYLIPAGISWDIYTIYTMSDFEVSEQAELYIVIGVMLAIVLPIMLLQYLALYKYSFKSDNIWK